MSGIRTTLKAAFKAAVAAAAPTIAIEKWDGEEEVFNSAHAWPGISVVSDGIDFGEFLEIRDDDNATYQRDHIFHVFVYAAHNTQTGEAGDDIAEEILDNLENGENGVAGQEIASLGLAEIIGEKRVHAHMGRFLYVQAWKIQILQG